MDFSKNLTYLFKFEPQLSHFNKSQYSLHCTLKHKSDNESPFCYKFYLSDEMKHNHAFTSSVVNDIIQKHDLPLILRFKSDNCSTQYKCKWVFRFWSNLAKKLNTKIIIYNGASGHGKGLLDAMGTISVKSPLTRAVTTQNLEYSCAKDIYEYLNDYFIDDEFRLCSIQSPEEISKFVIYDLPLSITKCMKLHISYFPNRSIQSKVNICSRASCTEDEFISCLIEKGKIVQVIDEASDNDDSNDSSEGEFENDISDDESKTEAYELKAESVDSILKKNTTIALYFASSSLELFYLCKVLDFGIADENMIDDYNHLIPKGSKCIKCHYYQKRKESRSGIRHKLFP